MKKKIEMEKILLFVFIASLIASVLILLFVKNYLLGLFFLIITIASGYLNRVYLKKVFFDTEETIQVEKPKTDDLLMNTKKRRLKEFLNDEKLDEFYQTYQSLFNENKYIMTEIYKQLFSKRFAYTKNFFKLPFKFEHALKRTLEVSNNPNSKTKLDYEYYHKTLVDDIFIFTKNKYGDCEEIAIELAKMLLFEDKDIIDYITKNTINNINISFKNLKVTDKDDILDIEMIFTSYYFAKIIIKIFNLLKIYKRELLKNEEFILFITTAIIENKDYKKTLEIITDIYQEKYNELINEEDFKLLIYLLCLDYNAKEVENGYDLDIPRIAYKYDPLFKSFIPLTVKDQALKNLDPYKQFASPISEYFTIKYSDLINYAITSQSITPAMIQKEFHISYDESEFLIDHLEKLKIIEEGNYIHGRTVLVSTIPENINPEEFIIKNQFNNYLSNLNLVIPETIYKTLVDISSKEEYKGLIYHNQSSIIDKILYSYLSNKNLEDQIIAIESSSYWGNVIEFLLKDYKK